MMNCCKLGKPASDSYTPRGTVTTIGPLQVYVSACQASTDSRGGLLLLLPDGFGFAKHNLILADDFAKEGWKVIVPDYFEGEPLPIEVLRQSRNMSIDEQPWPEEEKQKLRDLDFPAWLQRHNPERVTLLLNGLVAELRRQHEETSIVGVGYCFGGKHVLRLAKTALMAAAAFHPSFVTADDLYGIQAPLYIGLAEKDDMVPASLPSDLEKWASTKMKQNVPFILETYADMNHGFAARPDTEDELILQQYQAAFQRTLQHFSQFT
ncbi:hypothetical protein LTR10_014530 [Elasticomyces elasticus]|nr:hypothetical protein LTR10_014530 [Elasticomyces elasticus]KAK5043065.1 hypothetical protein LTR13_000836 [Exophiala sideris]KAK5186483.1 hypothetical protein LTR44_001539 [Eurotiomycetes sp. CCFEE 6388]